MISIFPVVPGLRLTETVFVAEQLPYVPLLGWRGRDGLVVTRWRLTWKERFQIFFGGSLWLEILTFYQIIQPVKLSAVVPIEDMEVSA